MTDEPQVQQEQEEAQADRAEGANKADSGSEQQLAAVVAERDEAIDRWKRTAADFDNFRKRALREREEYVTLANERLVKELLPILDDLERALVAATEHQEVALEDGVRLVHQSLEQLLKRQGIKEIDAAGMFDPHVHEALLSQPSEAAEGSVIDVVQKGYTLGDRVVRPARVVVAAPPQSGSDG